MRIKEINIKYIKKIKAKNVKKIGSKKHKSDFVIVFSDLCLN